LEYLREAWKCSEFKDSKFKGILSEGNFNGEKILLLKPMTFMNLSGESVMAICNFYKLDPKKDITVIFDDVSMEYGKIRHRIEGSAGGHNGIKSIISCTGSEIFSRIKIGVGNDTKYDLSDWVLSKFSQAEQENLVELFEQTKKVLESYLS
jgi:PTH1 family peptidyl-tRNA hydrolase